MPPSDAGLGLGPLPIADRNQELQQLSIDAIHRTLPVDRFITRDERVRDAGVDLSLEIVADGRQTNLRSQVQMKATGSPNQNQDGSVSVEVSVSSLNYLLNGGPAPLYFLYVEPWQELRFVWAKDEVSRLEKERPDWLQQGSVTIRFSRVVDPEGIAEIYSGILQQTKFARLVSDALNQATTTDLTLRISLPDYTIQDGEDAYKFLTASGIALVASGKSAEVLNLVKLLTPAQAGEPHVRVVTAYAHYTRGRYLDALSTISSALLQAGSLTAEDRQFLRFLKDGSNYQTGRIDAQQYAARLKEQAEGDDSLVAQFVRLGYLRYQFLAATSNEMRADLLRQSREVVETILRGTDRSDLARLQAEVSLLVLEGADATYRLYDELCIFFIRAGENEVTLARLPVVIHDLTKELVERMDRAIQQAQKSGALWLFADALCAKASVRLLFLGNLRLLSVLGKAPDLSLEQLTTIDQDLNIAMTIYKGDDNLEGLARSKMLMALLLDITGNKKRATELGQQVLSLAEALGYSNLESVAQRMASGSTRFDEALAEARRASQWTSDEVLAQYTPQEIEYMAEMEKQAMGLPDAELPTLRQQWEIKCNEARQRLSPSA